jgi:hypothetical protein
MVRSKLSQKGLPRESGQGLILIIILILIIGSVMMVGGFSKVKTPEPPTSPSNLIVVTEIPGQAQNNLQLKTFSFITPAPPVCTSGDDGICHSFSENVCCADAPYYCSHSKCTGSGPFGGKYDVNDQNNGKCNYGDSWCMPCGDNEGFTCVGKPVIYLYPEETTKVKVYLQIPGEIIKSNPVYPVDGWKNIEAHPDGRLVYDNKIYSELFYESKVGEFLKPSTGIVIARSELEAQLGKLVYQLGLNQNETDEFLAFWIPQLKSLKSNYILFSILDQETKDALDHVEITPEPDTRIEFIAYFKPLDFPIAIEPLRLGPRPTRQGFTIVEWGGAIDSSGSSLFLQ